MAYNFTLEELEQINLAYENADAAASNSEAGKFKSVYDLIYSIVTNESFFYDTPVEGLEENVWIWIGGASQVNSGTGYFADFIREYTRTQYELRYRITISDEELNIASNKIARNFIEDILEGSTPSIEELGLIDAAPIAGDIFNQVFPSNYTPWSGTLLFPFLGVDSYYRDWLLTEESVGQFKPLPGTYDLISTAAASIPLVGSVFEVGANLIYTFGFSGTYDAFLKTKQLAAESDSFIKSVYQLDKYDFSLDFGEDLFGLGGKSANYIVGTLGSDTYSKNVELNLAINGTEGKDVIHAGLGDDYIFANNGADLIDAGEGDDVIDTGHGDDVVVSGAGADKIIVGQGHDVILDGSNDDRLYFRGSQIGISLIDGEDILFPLLGGVNTYIADTTGVAGTEPEEIYYDTDGDGNIEYWYAAKLQTTIANNGGGITILNSTNYLNGMNLDPFAIVYEMDGSDLEIKFFRYVEAKPVFSLTDDNYVYDYWNFHSAFKPTFQVTLADYQEGQFGIQLSGPLNIGTVYDDDPSMYPDYAAIDTHNATVSYINNGGIFAETLGQPVATRPISDSTDGQPVEFTQKGGAADDEIQGDETDDLIDGQAGDDIINGEGGDDQLSGGFGNDVLTGGKGNDILNGGAGDDVIFGGAGSDTNIGGSGNDTINYSGSGGGFILDFENGLFSGGDAEDDTLEEIETVIGSNFNDTIIGSNEAETFYGGAGDDTLNGNAGNDVLAGGAGADILQGGAGQDVVSYEDSNAAIMVDLVNQVASGGTADGDQISEFEGAIGSDYADTLIGDEGANILRGGAGADIIFGGGADDIIEGGAGIDTLDGGTGNDTLDYSNSAAAVSVNLGQGLATGGDAEADNFTNFENISGSALNDTLIGDAGDNIILGNEGDDYILATSGADVIHGGAGADTLDFSNATESLTADLGTFSFAGGLANNLTALSIENITGTNYNDHLTGNDADNTFIAGAGDDLIEGAAGDDYLDGGDGTNDIAIYSGARADYTITKDENGALKITDLRNVATTTSHDGTDTIINIETLQFAGTAQQVDAITLDNAGPVSVNDTGFITSEGASLTIAAATLLANDFDYDGDELTIVNVLNAKNGQVVLLPNGDIEFTPSFIFNGISSFDYQISDGQSGLTTSTVTIDVTPVNNNPIAINDTNIALYAGEPTTIEKEKILINDLEFDGDDISIISVEALYGGSASLTAEGDVLFVPSAVLGEWAEIRYGISDGQSGAIIYASVISQLTERHEFTAADDNFAALENQEITIDLATLLANDTNLGTQTPVLQNIADITNGTMTLNEQGDFVFTPDQNFIGEASFTYTVSNNEGGEDTGTVRIDFAPDPQNQTPVANDDLAVAGAEDQQLLILAATLLANDQDADNDTLTIINVANPVNGQVELTGEGNVLFTPFENYNGPASFNYTISDSNGGVSTATVQMDISSVNDAPENLIITSHTIAENSQGGTIVGQLMVTDPDNNDTISYAITGGDGAALFEVNGEFLQVIQNANLDFEQQENYTVSIQATDQAGLTTSADLTITLTDVQEDSTIVGTINNDILNGTSGDDVIDALAGDDQIFAGAGDDILIGGTGADQLDGGAGNDTVDYSGSTSGITILLSTYGFRPYGIGFGGEAANDHLTNIENVTGSAFADIIIGDSAANILDGNSGNDYLSGGLGRDQFVFKEGYGRDTILDFHTSGTEFEKIEIDFEGIDNFSDLSDHISSTGFFQLSTRIEFDSGDRLTLLGVRADDLTADHFEFV